MTFDLIFVENYHEAFQSHIVQKKALATYLNGPHFQLYFHIQGKYLKWEEELFINEKKHDF